MSVGGPEGLQRPVLGNGQGKRLEDTSLTPTAAINPQSCMHQLTWLYLKGRGCVNVLLDIAGSRALSAGLGPAMGTVCVSWEFKQDARSSKVFNHQRHCCSRTSLALYWMRCTSGSMVRCPLA